jgi:serine/threonine protein kinase
MGDKVTFGHYRVLQRDDSSLWELGSSATGVTYKALDTHLQRPVALKVINSDLVADEVSLDRFLREARARAGLRHSHIASIYHLGQDEKRFFYAMEFIEGQTIESYVEGFGPMPLRPALHIASQVSKALAAAARQQCVHRDITRANIMIVADSEEGDWPFVKLTDFGLIRSALVPHDSDGTMRPGLLGTAQSGGPEQIEEGKLDARSDMYSVGCMLWYLLTGEGPFTGSLTSDFAQHPGDEPPGACRVWSLLTGDEPVTDWQTSASTHQLGGEPPWEKLKPFPRPIRRLLRRMLRKEPSQRPASAIELQREIEQCSADVARREALTARFALPLNIRRQWLTLAPWTRRTAIFGASVMGLVLALGYWNSDPPPQSAPAPQTSDVVAAQDSANSDQSLANEGWSYLSACDEPFRSLAPAPRLSFAEPMAADPGIIDAKSWLHAESIWDGADAAKDDPWSGQGGDRFSTALASDYSPAVGGSEDKKVAVAASEGKKAAVRKASIRGKKEVKKTSKRYAYANYSKNPQRRVTSRDRDRGFNPLEVVQRAREQIRRVIRRIL